MIGSVAAMVLATLVACLNPAARAGGLPDRQFTPGTTNAAISEQQYRAQCNAKGWTRLYRPAVSFTNSLKKLQMKQYGYPLADIRDFEEDHLIPLCLAGAPQDPANLWPQPRFGEWSADRKDALEAKLCRLACDGKVPLAETQREIATDWIVAYRKHMDLGQIQTAARRVPAADRDGGGFPGSGFRRTPRSVASSPVLGDEDAGYINSAYQDLYGR